MISNHLIFLLRLADGVLAAHIRPEDLRNTDAAVRVQVVLQESNEHPRRRNDSVIQGVGEIFAVFPIGVR